MAQSAAHLFLNRQVVLYLCDICCLEFLADKHHFKIKAKSIRNRPMGDFTNIFNTPLTQKLFGPQGWTQNKTNSTFLMISITNPFHLCYLWKVRMYNMITWHFIGLITKMNNKSELINYWNWTHLAQEWPNPRDYSEVTLTCENQDLSLDHILSWSRT